jgi:hypothetical protein
MDGRVLGPKLVAYMRIRAQGQEDTAADMALVRITSTSRRYYSDEQVYEVENRTMKCSLLLKFLRGVRATGLRNVRDMPERCRTNGADGTAQHCRVSPRTAVPPGTPSWVRSNELQAEQGSTPRCYYVTCNAQHTWQSHRFKKHTVVN